jgi:hypothetical protein
MRSLLAFLFILWPGLVICKTLESPTRSTNEESFGVSAKSMGSKLTNQVNAHNAVLGFPTSPYPTDSFGTPYLLEDPTTKAIPKNIPKSCKQIDFRKQLPPIRDQDSIGWCYAFATADQKLIDTLEKGALKIKL